MPRLERGKEPEVNAQVDIDQALRIIAENTPPLPDGKWLEYLTAEVGPHIKEWDIAECSLVGLA